MARTRSPDTRDRILDTAARLFNEHGVRAVGMQQIIDEAGCGKNLLYREFTSKDDLVTAYLNRYRRDWASLVEGATRPLVDDPGAQLVAITKLAAAQVEIPDYRGCAFRNCYSEFRDPGHPVGEVAAAQLRDVSAHIHDLAGRTGAADPGLLAERVWLVIEGLYASGAHPGSERAGEVAVALVEELVANASGSPSRTLISQNDGGAAGVAPAPAPV
jgi:AcrR family transcriptional regulator